MVDSKEVAFRYHYTGFVDGEDGVYGVVVPEIQGCHGGGATIAEAVDDATSALATLVPMMQAAGEAIPEPRDADDVSADYQTDGGEWNMVVRIPLPME